jgi:hypothetical protein
LLAVLFGGSPYLSQINIAGEAGYERTVRVTQDDDARVSEQIQGVAGGQLRGSIITHAISIPRVNKGQRNRSLHTRTRIF